MTTPNSILFLIHHHASGYWLQPHVNTRSHALSVVDSGVNSTVDLPLQWSLSIGELKLDSGSISGSAFDDGFELDTRFDSLVYSCIDGENGGYCQNIDYVQGKTANMLDKKMNEAGDTYDKGFLNQSQLTKLFVVPPTSSWEVFGQVPICSYYTIFLL
jgi:hypothetical protein